MLNASLISSRLFDYRTTQIVINSGRSGFIVYLLFFKYVQLLYDFNFRASKSKIKKLKFSKNRNQNIDVEFSDTLDVKNRHS